MSTLDATGHASRHRGILVYSGNSPYGDLHGVTAPVGGAEASLRWLAEFAAGKGLQAGFVSITIGVPGLRITRKIVEFRGVRVSHVVLPKPWRLWRRVRGPEYEYVVRELTRQAQEIQAGVIVCYLASPDVQIAATAAERCGVELVIKIGGRTWAGDWHRAPVLGMTVSSAVRFAEWLVVESEYARDESVQLFEQVGEPMAREKFIRSIFGSPGLASRGAQREETPSRPYVLFPASLKPGSKRQDLLIEALATPEGVDSGLEAVFAGGGQRLEELKRLAARLHVDDRVTFLGPVGLARLGALMLGAECTVMLSDFEFAPKSFAEAVLARVKVVASDIPSIRELVPPMARDAILVDNDVAAIARKLASCKNDEEIRAIADAVEETASSYECRLSEEPDQLLQHLLFGEEVP